MKITKLLAVLIIALALLHPGPAAGAYAKQRAQPKFPERMKEQVRYFSGAPMLLRAETMGITMIAGKDISQGSKPAKNKKGRGHDVPIGVNPVIHENEPTVAANPVNTKNLVAGSHYIGETGNSCVVYTSSNSGANWSLPVAMPQLTEISFCSDPVLAYAPDGSRVYYAYMDIKSFVDFTETTITFTDDWDIVVSFSGDNGKTWTGPVVALDGDLTSITFDINTGEILEFEPGFLYDKPWISTALDAGQKNWVYLTTTRFDSFIDAPSDCHITFTRSGDQGNNWDAPTLLDSSSDGCGNPVVVQGSRPAGGKGGNVLVAWYHSGSDGWLAGGFQIRTRFSSNNGATWNNIVTAAADSHEAPFWLGPEAFYHRWWGVMFPDVEIDGGGAAHIAYTHDPAANPEPGFSDTAEDGDIRYITSSGPPYNNWSAPLTVNDDGMVRAQGWATLETRTKNKATTVYLIWEDHRLSPELPTVFPSSPNLYYDIFSATKGSGSSGWFPNERISDLTSIVDFIFIGDYFDLAINDQLVFGIWTDRRDKTTIFDFEDDVFGSWKLK
ncbi:MAG TPA: sialidase family protein [Anaerolineales bacterium]|nr:sialidase family protein [Anaerolineales bacterium]